MEIEFNDVAQIILAMLVGLATVMNAYARIIYVRRLPMPETGRAVLPEAEPKAEPGQVEQLTPRIRRERRG